MKNLTIIALLASVSCLFPSAASAGRGDRNQPPSRAHPANRPSSRSGEHSRDRGDHRERDWRERDRRDHQRPGRDHRWQEWERDRIERERREAHQPRFHTPSRRYYHPAAPRWLPPRFPQVTVFARPAQPLFVAPYDDEEESRSELGDWRNHIPAYAPNGWYLARYPNGAKAIETFLLNGVPNGWFTRWFPNGQKAEEGFYRNGVRDGSWTSWYRNGQQRMQCSYQSGTLNGWWTRWYRSGQMAEQGVFQYGRATGWWTTWFRDGQLASQDYVN